MLSADEQVNENTTVCIAGVRMPRKESLKVLFGDKQAKILEASQDLLVCYPPLGLEGQVQVRVFNGDVGSEPLLFTYK
jgi:hypothetical protein